MTDRSQQLTSTLLTFYEKPIAKVSLELFLSIGLVTLLAVFAIQPTLVTMTDLIAEIQEKQELNAALKKKVSALQTAQTVYAAAEPKLELLEEAVPSQPELVYSLKILEKLASENDVIITSINTQQIPAEKPSSSLQPTRKALPITISVTGDYVGIRSFANDVLNARRTFTIDTINFSIVENRGVKSLSAGITLNAPYYGDSAQ